MVTLADFTIPDGVKLAEQDYDFRNLYDCSGFKTGDEVISYLDPGKIGRIDKVSRWVLVVNQHWDYLWVYWDDGTADCYYPSQLLKVKPLTELQTKHKMINGPGESQDIDTLPLDF